MPDALPDSGEITFLKHRDAGGVLNATFALIRRNARGLLGGFLAIVAPAALAAGVAAALFFRAMGEVMGEVLLDPEAAPALPDTSGLGASMLGVMAFGYLVAVTSFAVVGAFVRLYRAGDAEAVTVGVLWDEAKDLLLPMAGFVALLYAVYLASSVVGMVPCLGAIAWLGFWVWALPYVMTTYAARVTEEPTLGAAFRRAQTLVKGAWGGAAGALLLSIIVAVGVAVALFIPVYLVMVLVGFGTAMDDPSSVFALMGAIMAPFQVISVAVNLIPLVAAFFVHGRLVEELDGTSLYDDLDALADRSPAARWADEAPASEPADDRLGDPPPPAPEAGPEDGDGPAGGFRGGGFRGGA